MDIVRILVTILALVLFPKVYGIDSSEISKSQQLSYDVISSFAEKKINDGLTLCGIGGGSNKGKRTKFELIFQTNQLYEVRDARELLLKLIEDFLGDINQNEIIRPYLSKHPFPVKSIRIAVLVYADFSEREKYLASFSINNGSLDYAKGIEFDEGRMNFDSVETYEEALAIVKGGKDSLPTVEAEVFVK